MQETATYFCHSCGEQITITLDASAGRRQQYVEDCPVCCRPNVLHVTFDRDGDAHVQAEAE